MDLPAYLPIFLNDLHQEMKEYPYKLCRLTDYGGDTKRRWYISYYIWDLDKQKLVRKKYSEGFNHIGNARQRRRKAVELMNQIDAALEEGYVLGEADKQVNTHDIKKMTFIQAMEYVYEEKAKELREGTLSNYRSVINRLKVFCEKRGYLKMNIRRVNSDFVREYLSYMRDERGIANKTYNDQLVMISGFIQFLMKKDRILLRWNPCEDIDVLKVNKSDKHAAYSSDQMKLIKEEMIRQDQATLLRFVMFIYFTLARPNEIENMKVEHIDLQERRIYIPAKNSKNTRGDYIGIFKPLENIIREAKICDYSQHYYVFGRNSDQPGEEPVSEKWFYRRHVKILRALGLDKSERDYDLYSYKHSGAINMYLAGVSIRDIQVQCRHKTMDETMNYMRNLDLFRSKEHLDMLQEV